MSAETAFTVASIVCQSLGLAAAADGFRRTFKSSAAPGERFFKRVLATEAAMLNRWWTALVRGVRRLLRRPSSPVTGTLGAALEVSAAMNARGLLQFGPLPDATQEPAAFATEIERRLNQVYRLTQDVEHNLKEEQDSRREADQRVASELETRISSLDEEAKHGEIRGLHEQVLGWFFVVLGLVAQALADLVL
ncbi:hypothetical protein [Streptomyces sp. NPDC051214]|uniref:hypothetical protein n=1 Tax=Streptomyces sp. NPDC051214 TaxID=3155282 RepID=UPI00342AF643